MTTASGCKNESDSETSDETGIGSIVDEISYLLPGQAPLHAFVHHNTLHAFEDLPFETATVEAAQLFGTEPFQSEEAFAGCLASGRIQVRDLEAVVDEYGHCGDAAPLGGLSRTQFTLGRLQCHFAVPRGAALEWTLSETLALCGFHPEVTGSRKRQLRTQARSRYGATAPSILEEKLCTDLWASLAAAASSIETLTIGAQPGDRVRDGTRTNPDPWVHPLLIRFCAAYLDQGIAYWTMPDRSHGFLDTFRRLYGLQAGPPDRWLRGLPAACSLQLREEWSAERTIVWALHELAVDRADWPTAIRRTLLSLSGWAGMVQQFEKHPDRAPVEPRPARLIDYLAVKLTLETIATRHAQAEECESMASRHEAPPVSAPPARANLELAYEAYVAAQLLDTELPGLLDPAHATAWLEAIRACDSIERRRLLHLAYERRHRIGVLDGLLAHGHLPAPVPPEAEFQAVFCIDDREESMRRHLEEVFPACETFGYAGFFGVAMIYQGLDDIRGKPLCPISIPPAHMVFERAIDGDEELQYRSARRQQGIARHNFSIGSRSMVRGSVLTAATGLASIVPLVGRSLFPRTAEHWAHRADGGARTVAPPTRLQIERDATQPAKTGEPSIGYSIEEMAGIVETLLRTTGIAGRPRPLVLIVGHGSSSLNNPHEAAHDCGATGGGRGGPNARAFAAMANHSGVRAILGQRGIALGDDVWFVGAYHNTCDDSLSYYDEDLIPAALRGRLDRAAQALTSACALNAHERCRRFGTSPGKLSLDEAVAEAETHAADLAQPRPEYGHATNAVCIVGSRAQTRGLFLDRRAFLVSYDSAADAAAEVLTNLLLAVGPVCAGINLEYYFSFVDPTGYGCGTKLPHNIVGLFGVMDGHASDLRTGLPWQMVEIHEPVRLLMIVEAEPETLRRLLDAHPTLATLVRNRWIQLVSWNPRTAAMEVFAHGDFLPYTPETSEIPVVQRSPEFYAGHRQHLGCAHVTAAFGAAPV